MKQQLAVVQCTSLSLPDENKVQLDHLISQAVRQGAGLILLPEMCLSMDSRQYQNLANDPADRKSVV
jgi:predicted amidohydrolase